MSAGSPRGNFSSLDDDRENPVPYQQGPEQIQHDYAAQHWEQLACQHQDEDDYLLQLAGDGSTTLLTVVQLQVVVDTRSSSISHLGKKLPALLELNINNSVLESIRDLGTGFTRLQVLWVSRCGLSDVEGLSGLPSLRELYAAYNDIHDLQPVAAGCESLELLDIEGNCVTCVDSIAQLQGCEQLTSLVLTGNPVCSTQAYRVAVLAALPQLTSLDDEPTHISISRESCEVASSHDLLPNGWEAASGSNCSSLGGDGDSSGAPQMSMSRAASAAALGITLPAPLLQQQQAVMTPARALLLKLSSLDLGSLSQGGAEDSQGWAPALHISCQASPAFGNHLSSRPGSPSVSGLVTSSPSFAELESAAAAQLRSSFSYAGMDDAPAPLHLYNSASSDLSSELSMVLQGIKHARVGLDSQEFHQMEMGICASAYSASSGGGDASRRPPSAPSISSSFSNMLPAGASTWMRGLRGSHQGSLLRSSSSESSKPPLPPAINLATAPVNHRSSGAFSSPPTSPKSCSSLGSSSSSRPSSAAEPPDFRSRSIGGAGAGSLSRVRVEYVPNPGPRCGTAPDSRHSVGRPSTSRTHTTQELYQEDQHTALRNSSTRVDSTALQLKPEKQPKHQRPFSARLASSSGPGAAGSRLGSSSNPGGPTSTTSSASVGLYWSKHRQQAPQQQRTTGGDSSDAVVSATAAAHGHEAGDSSSSQLTRGSESSFGGSLAKDLRRWKGKARAAAVSGKDGISTDTAAGRGSGAGSSAPERVGGEGDMDHAALLRELRAWKVQTADIVLMEDSDEEMLDLEFEGSEGFGHFSMSRPGSREQCSQRDGEQHAPLSETLLRVSSGATLSDTAVPGSMQAGARETLAQVRPPSSARSRAPAVTVHPESGPVSLPRPQSRNGVNSSSDFIAAKAEITLPSLSMQKSASMNPVVVPRYAASKMLLSKVVRDVGSQPFRQAQGQHEGSESLGEGVRGVVDGRLEYTSSHYTPSSHQNMGASARITTDTPKALSSRLSARYQTTDAVEGQTKFFAGSVQDDAWDRHGQMRVSESWDRVSPSSVGEGGRIASAWDGLAQAGDGQSPYQVVCASGEVDLRAVNPRPRPQQQVQEDSDEETS